MISNGQFGVDAAQVARAAAVLQEGFLVVFPTDTVYGVAADPRVDGALDRIYEAKVRDRGKPIPFLISSVGVLARYGAQLSDEASRIAGRFWPGPVTLVLPCREGRIAFRIPDHPVALAVIESCGGCLYATSANISGEPPAETAQLAADLLAPHVRAVVDGPPRPNGKASSVVKVEDGKIEMLRDGAVSIEEVIACLKGS